jgi:hypothetical protein
LRSKSLDFCPHARAICAYSCTFLRICNYCDTQRIFPSSRSSEIRYSQIDRGFLRSPAERVREDTIEKTPST